MASTMTMMKAMLCVSVNYESIVLRKAVILQNYMGAPGELQGHRDMKERPARVTYMDYKLALHLHC